MPAAPLAIAAALGTAFAVSRRVRAGRRGQVDVPHVTRFFAKLAGNPYLHGFYRLDRTDLYVSAGIGHSLHGLRAGKTCPEIAVFELDPAATERRSSMLRTTL